MPRRAVTFYFILHGIVAGTWISRIPAVSEGLRLEPAVLGWVLVGNMLGALLSGLTSGFIVDRYGSRRITLWMGLGLAGFLPLVAIMPSAAYLFVGLFIHGFIGNTLNIAMNTQATALENRYGRPILSSFHALWSLGALLGALSGAGLAGLELSPFWHFALVGLVLGGVSLGLNRWLLESPSQRQLKPKGAFVWPKGTLLFLGLLGFCAAISDGTIPSWSGVYLRSLGAPESVAALGYAVHQGIMLIGRSTGDWFAMKFGADRLVRFGAMLGGVGLAIGITSRTVEGAFFGIACMGFGMATIYPLIFAAAARTPGVSPAAAMATASSLSTMGGLFGPIIMGNVAEFGGVAMSFYLAALLAAVVSYLAFSLSGYQVTRPTDTKT